MSELNDFSQFNDDISSGRQDNTALLSEDLPRLMSDIGKFDQSFINSTDILPGKDLHVVNMICWHV